ncbi:MAG TPA: hypothetical protein PKX03_02260, partial [Candidatus Paceibacterota bacterium]|nr:hypothetical protein [Candidatus Paceibacterota bacterium]
NLVAQLGVYATPSTIITNKLPLDFDAQTVEAAYEGSSSTVSLGDGILVIGAQPYSTFKSIIDGFIK